MAATTKADLKEIAEKEFTKLQAFLSDVIDDQARAAGPDSGPTIKDIVGHRAHWNALFLGWYADGQAGKTVYFPAKGYKWSDLKRYNADLRHRQADMGWSAAKTLLHNAHLDLMRFIAQHTDADLYCAPMKGAKNTWTPGRWAEAAGPSHYRSAAKYIRACRKAFA